MPARALRVRPQALTTHVIKFEYHLSRLVRLEVLAKCNAAVRLSFVDERRYTYRFATAREAQGFCAVLRSAWRRPTSERKESPAADNRLSLRPPSSQTMGQNHTRLSPRCCNSRTIDGSCKRGDWR